MATSTTHFVDTAGVLTVGKPVGGSRSSKSTTDESAGWLNRRSKKNMTAYDDAWRGAYEHLAGITPPDLLTEDEVKDWWYENMSGGGRTECGRSGMSREEFERRYNMRFERLKK